MLRLCLDSFGDQTATGASGELDHPRDDCVTALVSIEARDEAPVELHVVRAKLDDVRKKLMSRGKHQPVPEDV